MGELLHKSRQGTGNSLNLQQSQLKAADQKSLQNTVAKSEEEFSKEPSFANVLQGKWDSSEGGEEKNQKKGPVPPMVMEEEEEPVQRKGPVPLQLQAAEDEEMLVQRKGPVPLMTTQCEGEESIQRRGPVPPMNIDSDELSQSSYSRSNKMPHLVQRKMESSFGEDFSDVNIHANSSQSKDLNAHAFAKGNDIHFATGMYNPESQKGQELLGHELTHVVQQRQGRVQPTAQKKGVGINDDAGLEKEADEMGEKAAKGETTSVQNGAPFSIQKSDADKVEIQAGSIALAGEGGMNEVRNIHFPLNSPSSGVTLGKGYDMGTRTKEDIKDNLIEAGVPEDQATKISEAAGLKGSDAKQFVIDKKQSIGKISEVAVLNLFNAEWTKMKATTKSFATSNRNSGGNARSREVKEGKTAGTYVLTSEEWDNLHPALSDLLTDMKYHGGYYAYDRIAKINEAIKAHDGDQIGQLKAVRELFTSGYIEDYSEQLPGIQRGRHNSKETFFGQVVNYEGKFRRDEIRLTFLNHVISSLEAGKVVEITSSSISTSSASTNNSGNPSTATVPPQTIIPAVRGSSNNGGIADTVGLGGRNQKSDIVFVQKLLFKAGFNIPINGFADEMTINAIKDFQKIKIPQITPDGIITPGKKTILVLNEFGKGQRINAVKENKEGQGSKVNILEVAYENYKKGSITIVTLASKIKQCNYPNTVVNIFNSISYLDRDNLAFSVANQCNDEDLRRFDKKILYCLADGLDTFFGTKNWSANIAQRNRVMAVLNTPVKENKNVSIPNSHMPNPQEHSNNRRERVLKDGVDIKKIGEDMKNESRYQIGAAYIDTERNGHNYNSGEIIPGANHTWCNQFAMDLALKISNKDPFEHLPNGKLGSRATDILDFMKKGNGFEKIQNLNNAWTDYINKGELVYFVDSGHIATGIPTSEAEFLVRKDNRNVEYKFGRVVQAGKDVGVFNLNKAWRIDNFKNLSIYVFKG